MDFTVWMGGWITQLAPGPMQLRCRAEIQIKVGKR